MHTFYKYLVVFAIAVVAGWSALTLVRNADVRQSQEKAGSIELRLTGAFTNTSSTVNTTSTRILSELTSLMYARISNLSSSTIFCYFDGTQTAATSSVQVNAGYAIYPSSTANNFLEIAPDSPLFYVQALNCIASSKAPVAITYHP